MAGGGELDDRETLVIEVEMDKLRMGGYLMAGLKLSSLKREEKRLDPPTNRKSRWYH